MNNFKRKLLAVVLSVSLIFSFTAPSFAATVNSDGHRGKSQVAKKTVRAVSDEEIKTIISDISKKGVEMYPAPASGSYWGATYTGEWTLFGMNRGKYISNASLDNLNDKYITNISREAATFTSVEQYLRAINTLSSIGVDVKKVGGVNLVDKLIANPDVKGGYGANNALNTLAAIRISGVEVDKSVTDEIIDYVYDIENYIDKDTRTFGYYNWYNSEEWIQDYDTAGLALYALAGYQDNDKAKELINANKEMIINAVKESDNAVMPNMGSGACTNAQVITGLTAIGVDIDNLKSKNDTTLVDALVSFYLKDENMFAGYGGSADSQATDQGLYGLVAYCRARDNKADLFSAEDISFESLEDVTDINVDKDTVTLNKPGDKDNISVTSVPEGAAISMASSDEKIASVTDEGVITAKDSGETEITVYASKGNRISKTVKVKVLLGKFGTVKAVPGNKQVKLSGFAVKGAEKYEVYQSLKKNSDFKKIATVTSGSFTSDKLSPGVVYYYQIKAISGDAQLLSSVVSADVKVAAPTKVKAKVGKKKVTVTFKKSANAKKYIIYRATKKNGKYKKIKTVTKAKYVDKKVKKGKKYFYKVKAQKSSSNISAFSSVAKTKKVK